MSESFHAPKAATDVLPKKPEANTTPAQDTQDADHEVLPSDTPQAVGRKASPGASLEEILSSWSVEEIRAYYDGNTEQAASTAAAAGLLAREFQSNWFRAKAKLLTDEHGKTPDRNDRAARANALMQGLHGLRALDMKVIYEATRVELKAMEPGLMLIEHLKQKRDNIKTMIADPHSSLYAAGPNETEAMAAARLEVQAKRKALAKKKEEMLLKWGSSGSTTITSDIDSNPKGAYSVLTVRKFNELFRKQGGGGGGWPFEAGTVYDINVYGQDYMGDWPPFDIRKEPIDEQAGDAGGMQWTVTTHQEVELGESATAEFLQHQEVMTHVHVLRYMNDGQALDHELTDTHGAKPLDNPDASEWQTYRKTTIAAAQSPAQAEALTDTLDEAEDKYQTFRKRVLEAEAVLSGEEDTASDPMLQTMLGAETPGTSPVDRRADSETSRKGGHALRETRFDDVQLGKDEQLMAPLEAKDRLDHFDHAIITMAASNRIYEQMEIEVIRAREAHRLAAAKAAKLREELPDAMATLTGNPFGALVEEESREADEEAEEAGLALKKAMIDALYFANEVYMAEGAVQFAVGFKQGVGKDAREESDLHGGRAVETTLEMSQEQFLHSFTENVGDALKELNHLANEAKEANEELTAQAALVGGAKYLDRMMESAQYVLGVAGFNAALTALPELRTVTDVAAAKSALKANVDLQGRAELHLADPDPKERMLSHMRVGNTWADFQATLTEDDRATLKQKEQEGKLDLTAVEANWGDRALNLLDAEHQDDMTAALEAGNIADGAALRQLVITFGARIHEWLPEAGATSLAKSKSQKETETSSAQKPTKLDQEIGDLETPFAAMSRVANASGRQKILNRMAAEAAAAKALRDARRIRSAVKEL